MIQMRLQVPQVQTHFWDQQSLLEHVDSAIKCHSPTVEDSVPITRITETESDNGALYCGFRRMSQPRVPCSPKPIDRNFEARSVTQISRPRSILKRRNDPFRATRPKRTVSFNKAQYHRPEEHYRNQDEFDRNSASYTPGIYADLSGNGYEDTSRCSPADLFDTDVDSYQPTSHNDLEKAMRSQIQLSESQDSLPLPRAWLSEQLANYYSEHQSKIAQSSSQKESKSGRSKKPQRDCNMQCGAQSKEHLRSQSQVIETQAVSA